uniref:keratin, type I cytoskeletal 13-like n=1 Tax=Pristiophorus japonicus TaxID=55135 RepID=UPI00398F4A94
MDETLKLSIKDPTGFGRVAVKKSSDIPSGLWHRARSYLDFRGNTFQKVRDLESANTQLELQLKEFQIGKAITGIDYDAYDAVIKPLRAKILSVHLGNARLALDLDNATLAAKDYGNKFENEFSIRQSVEADIADLKCLKEEYLRNYKELESEIVVSQDELAFLKKNHEEELIILRQKVTGTVSVDVASEPSADLTQLLAQIRDEYETICTTNQAELDVWYKQQLETQTVQTVQVNEAAEGAKLQISELRKQFQTLQAEYDSLYSGNCSLESSIQEIKDSYCQKLLCLNETVSQLELEVTSMRNDILQKSKDYKTLLNIKMELEMEIANYKQLLEGIMISQGGSSTETSGSTIIQTTKTAIQRMR